MRTAGLLALGLLIATPSLAQDEASGRHQVAPDNNWSITDSDCMIDAGWGDDIGIVVNRHLDHHDLGIYDPAFKNVVAEKVITVHYAANGNAAGRGDYEALGHREGKQKSYVIEADDGLLDTFAATNSFQFYRGKTLEIELDMTGFAGALAAMRACEAALPTERMDQAMPAEEGSDAASETKAAAEAAADAAAQAATRP